MKNALTRERGTSTDMLTAVYLQWLGFITFALAFLLGLSLKDEGSTQVVVVSALAALFFVPYKPYQRWIKVQWDSIMRFLEKLFTSVFAIILVLVVGFLIIWGGWKLLSKTADFITPDNWTLMVCDEKLNAAECFTNSYVIPGFKSEKDCMLEGATRFSKQGFECGSNCKEENGIKVCKTICNKSGCN